MRIIYIRRFFNMFSSPPFVVPVLSYINSSTFLRLIPQPSQLGRSSLCHLRPNRTTHTLPHQQGSWSILQPCSLRTAHSPLRRLSPQHHPLPLRHKFPAHQLPTKPACSTDLAVAREVCGLRRKRSRGISRPRPPNVSPLLILRLKPRLPQHQIPLGKVPVRRDARSGSKQMTRCLSLCLLTIANANGTQTRVPRRARASSRLQYPRVRLKPSPPFLATTNPSAT